MCERGPVPLAVDSARALTCVAIHASWVFVIRTVKESTVRDIVNPFAGWVGSYDNFVGPMVFFWLVFIVVMIHLSVQHKSRQQGFPASTK